MGGYDEVKRRSLRLLDYLSALALELTQKPKRRLADYDAPVLRPAEIPDHNAVALGATSSRPSWLRVSKVDVPEPPRVPDALRPYLTADAIEPDSPPELRSDIEEWAQEHGEGIEEIQSRYQRWVATVWTDWSRAARQAQAARQLYQRLYEMRLRLQRDSATHELVWGFGVLCWAARGANIQHPLLLSKALIEMDVDTGTLSIVPDGPLVLETEPLEGLQLPALDELAALRDRLRLSQPDPWAPEGLGEVYRQVVAPLGLDATIVPAEAEPHPAATPVLVESWAVFVRPLPARHQRFYRELREVLDERDLLPEPIAAVVTDDAELTNALEGTGSGGGRSTAPETADTASLGARLLMPLPTNEEQERIARQLARSRGVTVQGPPGTGKTHTIANLVSHLVAHGQRVLVTAQNEQALKVLREKIPPELRDLSIAVLGSSEVTQGQLRSSVQAIIDVASVVDVEVEAPRVQRLAVQLDDARTRLRSLEQRLVELLADEAAEFELPSGKTKAIQVAQWLAKREPECGRIQDEVGPQVLPPLTPAELVELYRLASEINPADDAASRQHLPTQERVLTAAELDAAFRALDALRDDLADLENSGLSVNALDVLGPKALEALIRDVAASAETLAELEEPWLATAREQSANSESLRAMYAEQASELAALGKRVVELRRQTAGHVIELPDIDPRVLESLLRELGARFAADKGVPRWGKSELRELHKCVAIDDLVLRTPQDVELAIAELHGRTTTRKASVLYQQLAEQLGAPPMDAVGAAFVSTLEGRARRLGDAMTWEHRHGPALVTRLRQVLPGTVSRPSSQDLMTARDILIAASRRAEERAQTARLDVRRARLETRAGSPDASPLWDDLRIAFDRRDFTAWDNALVEARRLGALQLPARRRNQLAERLQRAAPLWTDRILTTGGDPEKCGEPERLTDMWMWRQAQTWLDQLHARGDVDTVQHQAEDASDEVRRLVLEVASRAARLGVKRSLRDDQRRALVGWLQALAKIGKGTGKFAGKWAAEARTQMPEAMGAVPVWIMPIHRVLENFDPRRTDRFDVVIVDEASQCDVLALGVLGLGRKVVVVGDDKQISPSAVGIERERVFRLISNHLPDLPQSGLLDIEASLYDIATRTFPGAVLLREHFRCAPEIIRFSNRFYDGRVLPLRERTQRAIGAPVRPVRVVDGARVVAKEGDVNKPEALALVDQIIACCQDPAYDGMSLGVVTLLGNGQPRLIENLLRDKLGGEEVERRKIRVGDPYHFQGDERDVIFLSLVADNDNRYAATRKSEQQRTNVAASRARDQLWIFHTIDPARMHPDDVRKHLLDYAYGANEPEAEITDLEQRCDSDFERAVLRELVERGYRVRPQHQVGHFRIDLVVEGIGDRLAVECDGDQFHGPEQWESDMRRQRTLERRGWKFWRVRGSAFYRNPQTVLAGLWDRLDGLGIQPRPRDAEPAVAALPSLVQVLPLAAGAAASESLPVLPIDLDPPHTTSAVEPPVSDDDAGPSAPDSVDQSEPSVDSGTSAARRADDVQARRTEAFAAGKKPAANGPTPVPAPEGYRSIAWLRPAEAAAVLEALQSRGDVEVPATADNVGSLVRYFAPTTPDARKYRANALVCRRRRSGDKIVAWVREHEARAIVMAAETKADQPIIDEHGHQTGLVDYFPADSEAARTFRSTTRLLRTR